MALPKRIALFVIVLALVSAMPGKDARADHQVIFTHDGVSLCYRLTFEGGGQFLQIHPETGGLVPNTPIRFPLDEGWFTITSGLPYANNPSGVTIGLFGLDDMGVITFEEPVARVSLFYASDVSVTLSASDKDGIIVDSENGPDNVQPEGFTKWDAISVETQGNAIERVEIDGHIVATAIDDFEACVIGGVLPVGIDVLPGSPTNTVNLSGAGVIPVAILSTNGFDAPSEVDPETLRLAGARVQVVGRGDREICQIRDVNGDGLDDYACNFENMLETEPGDSTVVLEGTTFFGVPIRGEGAISIVPDP